MADSKETGNFLFKASKAIPPPLSAFEGIRRKSKQRKALTDPSKKRELSNSFGKPLGMAKMPEMAEMAGMPEMAGPFTDPFKPLKVSPPTIGKRPSPKTYKRPRYGFDGTDNPAPVKPQSVPTLQDLAERNAERNAINEIRQLNSRMEEEYGGKTRPSPRSEKRNRKDILDRARSMRRMIGPIGPSADMRRMIDPMAPTIAR